MKNPSPRISREKKTIEAMVRLYCRKQHQTEAGLCPECLGLLEYALSRLDRCPYGEGKPTCGRCPVHCYQPAMREKVRDVMRYAGPRLYYRHPLLTFYHFIDARRKAPPGK